MTHHIIASNTLTALNNAAIGTRVVNEVEFIDIMDKAVKKFDFASQKVPGQGFILCPELAPHLSAGVGRRTENPDDYVVRVHRGRVDAYLKRERAAPCESAALLIYTVDAYLSDPDVQKDAAEVARVKEHEATHIIVAVLGFAGPKAPLTPYRFVHNLAGGNREAATWTVEDVSKMAREVIKYDAKWCVVAD